MSFGLARDREMSDAGVGVMIGQMNEGALAILSIAD